LYFLSIVLNLREPYFWKNKKRPSSNWDEERSLAVPPNLIEPCGARFDPLGSAVTGGAG